MRKLPTGVKYDGDKLRMNLLNLNHLDETIKVLMFGSKKYSDNNWIKVDNARERYLEACLRHIKAMQEQGGVINLDSKDEESGFPHLAHAMCCLYFLEHFRKEDLK